MTAPGRTAPIANGELLLRGFSAQRRSGLIWAAALLGLTLSVLAVWPSMSESGSLASLVSGMSPELIAAFGLEDLASPAGFLNGNLYAVLLPLLFAMLGITHMNSLTAGDEDAGRLELLLALPVSRVGVYLSRFAAVAGVLAGVAALTGAAVGFSGLAFDLELSPDGVVAVSLSMLLLGLFHAALVLALAGAGLRSPVVLGVAFAVLGLGYVLHALLPLVGSLADAAAASPWRWALGENPLVTGFDAVGIAWLVGGGAALVVVGLLAVRRRTIRTV